MNIHPRHATIWLGLGILPATAFWIVVTLAILFPIDGPARLLGGYLLSSGWLIPLLFLLVIALPATCVVGCLAVQGKRVNSSTQTVGWIALFLLLSNIGLISLFLLLLDRYYP